LESRVFSVAQFSQLSSPDAGVIFVEVGVPDLRTERAEKPISSASDPSILAWTGVDDLDGRRTVKNPPPSFSRYFNDHLW